MLTLADARAFALSLPEATEQDHHGFPSFRVRGKIYVTQPTDTYVHVMLDADDIEAAVAESPAACELVWWGKKPSAVRVHLAEADPVIYRELVTDAWRRRAPKTLVEELDGE
jgi:hypothetical protein